MAKAQNKGCINGKTDPTSGSSVSPNLVQTEHFQHGEPSAPLLWHPALGRSARAQDPPPRTEGQQTKGREEEGEEEGQAALPVAQGLLIYRPLHGGAVTAEQGREEGVTCARGGGGGGGEAVINTPQIASGHGGGETASPEPRGPAGSAPAS